MIRASIRTGTTLVVVGVLVMSSTVTGEFLHERAQADGPQTGALVSTATNDGPVGRATSVTEDLDSHLTVQVLTYDPGQSSGWHRHAGVHTIAVVSGALTVIDAACTVSTHTSDAPYVGGQDAHLAINDSDVPVQLVVTYVAQRHGAAEATTVVPAPPGCQAAA